MDAGLVQALACMNEEFYLRVGSSFSQTRSSAWQGWSQMLEACRESLERCEMPFVLDVACGNMRFARFLDESLGVGSFAYRGMDNCDALVASGEGRDFVKLNLVELLLRGGALARHVERPCDLICCFGFFHHVAGFENRAQLLRALLECARPGAYVAVSLWRFLDDERLAAKAEASHDAALRALTQRRANVAQLEANDRFLGWQDTQGVFRYCHHFDDDEITQLVAAVGDCGELVARFEADGRSGKLNTYLLFRKQG